MSVQLFRACEADSLVQEMLVKTIILKHITKSKCLYGDLSSFSISFMKPHIFFREEAPILLKLE